MSINGDPYVKTFSQSFSCKCGWAGLGSQCTLDSETELITSVRCPTCDRKLSLITNAIYFDDDPEMQQRWEKQKSLRRQLFQNIHAPTDHLDVNFSSITNETLCMKINGVDVYQYDAGFEGWHLIPEMIGFLREAHPLPSIHVHLDHLFWLLWGDDTSATSKLELELQELGVSVSWSD